MAGRCVLGTRAARARAAHLRRRQNLPGEVIRVAGTEWRHRWEGLHPHQRRPVRHDSSGHAMAGIKSKLFFHRVVQADLRGQRVAPGSDARCAAGSKPAQLDHGAMPVLTQSCPALERVPQPIAAPGWSITSIKHDGLQRGICAISRAPAQWPCRHCRGIILRRFRFSGASGASSSGACSRYAFKPAANTMQQMQKSHQGWDGEARGTEGAL